MIKSDFNNISEDKKTLLECCVHSVMKRSVKGWAREAYLIKFNRPTYPAFLLLANLTLTLLQSVLYILDCFGPLGGIEGSLHMLYAFDATYHGTRNQMLGSC